jgi:hypothetical protein
MNILQHLKDRGMDTGRYRINHDAEVACFYLYNLSGQLVGYQQYRPFADKECRNDPKSGRYYTHVERGVLAMWGLESFHYRDDVLCLTEGIFNACQLHRYEIPSLALLANDPKQFRAFLNIIGQTRRLITIADGDRAGNKMRKFGDKNIDMPDGRDLCDERANLDRYVKEILG